MSLENKSALYSYYSMIFSLFSMLLIDGKPLLDLLFLYIHAIPRTHPHEYVTHPSSVRLLPSEGL